MRSQRFNIQPLPPLYSLTCAMAAFALRYRGAHGAVPTARTLSPFAPRVKYTTLIELPATEKIMEAATGDKDFWIVDVVGNFCFSSIRRRQASPSNLNLITDKGKHYSFNPAGTFLRSVRMPT